MLTGKNYLSKTPVFSAQNGKKEGFLGYLYIAAMQQVHYSLPSFPALLKGLKKKDYGVIQSLR